MIEFKKYSSIENHFYKDYLDQVREQVPADMQSVSVFGELFGGSYPHPDVQRVGRLTMIQKGVYYAPDHEFYGFDIYVFTNDGGYYLSVDQAEGLFESEGFFYAKPLFKGTLDECLAYPNEFQSRIAEWLGYPPIEDNICEGIVIRPVTPHYLRTGSRALIKSKNARFAENKSVIRHLQNLQLPCRVASEA